jgi:ribonuclease BN (tRNA processing enzyme)
LSNPLSPIEIGELPANVTFKDAPPDGWHIGELTLRAALVAHRGTTLGYRISEGNGSLCYIPDHEPGLGLKLSSAPAGWISGHVLAHGAATLIHDAQYTDREYPARRGWGHSSITDTAAFAARAEPERLLMFHHDPSHDDRTLELLAEQANAECTRLGGDARIELARESEAHEL